MRNILVHEYFNVSVGMIWTIIKKDIPLFKKQIEGILSQKAKIKQKCKPKK